MFFFQFKCLKNNLYEVGLTNIINGIMLYSVHSILYTSAVFSVHLTSYFVCYELYFWRVKSYLVNIMRTDIYLFCARMQICPSLSS